MRIIYAALPDVSSPGDWVSGFSPSLELEASLRAFLELALASFAPAPPPPGPGNEWIPLQEAFVGTPYNQEYLSLLARMGRIEAIKRGRNWYTTRQAIQAYQDSL